MNNSKDKWLIAQQHEKEYYDKGKNLAWGIPHSLQFWKKFLRMEKIEDNTVEIGCGLNGLYNFSESVVGLDPINHHKRDFVLGVGEYLPFKHVNCVICCNGLDHFQNPQKAVDEMFNVSPKKIILWIYVHPKIVSWILGKFDKMHPYHFTRSDIWNLLKYYKFSSYSFEVSFFNTHWKYVKSKFAKFKLFVAHVLGVRGLCVHLKVEEEFCVS